MDIKHMDIVLCEFYFSDLDKVKKRPVLVFKDNLPYDDFIGMPISSRIDNMHDDELLLNNRDLEEGSLPKSSKLMLRKTFIISKNIVVKKYGRLSASAYAHYHEQFCRYFECNHD